MKYLFIIFGFNMLKYSVLHGFQELHVSFISSSTFHLMIQLQDYLVFKLLKKSTGLEKKEWIIQGEGNKKRQIDYANASRRSLVSDSTLQEISVAILCVCAFGFQPVQTFLCYVHCNGDEILTPECFSCIVLIHLLEVSKLDMLAGDHVEKDGDGGSSQLLLRNQSHLQDWTHHTRDKTDLMTSYKRQIHAQELRMCNHCIVSQWHKKKRKIITRNVIYQINAKF